MLVERGLDLGRVHVAPADQNHVGLTVVQVEVAMLVLPSHVTERLPVARPRFRGGTDVAVRGRRVRPATHPDLADLAGRQLATVRGEAAELAHEDTSDRPGVLEPLGPAEERG